MPSDGPVAAVYRHHKKILQEYVPGCEVRALVRE